MSHLLFHISISPVAAAHANLNKQHVICVLCGLLAAIILFGSFSPARADCMRDWKGRVVCGQGQCARNSHGEVYCSRYEDGAAIKNRYGEVVCGKGECVRTIKGDIVCSARAGGAALKSSRGQVRCEGGCEWASVRFCEQNNRPSR